MSNVIKTAGASLLGLLAVCLILAVLSLYTSNVDTGEVIGWNGVSPVTENSESNLGGTVGKLMESSNGPDTLSKVCDRTSNGVDDRQTIFIQTNFGLEVVAEHADRNGTAEGCDFLLFERGKAAHKVSSITGGNTSRH